MADQRYRALRGKKAGDARSPALSAFDGVDALDAERTLDDVLRRLDELERWREAVEPVLPNAWLTARFDTGAVTFVRSEGIYIDVVGFDCSFGLGESADRPEARTSARYGILLSRRRDNSTLYQVSAFDEQSFTLSRRSSSTGAAIDWSIGAHEITIAIIGERAEW